MGNVQIEVGGIMVDLRDKESLTTVIDEMLADGAAKVKGGRIKTNKNKRAETATLSFFGSINHYLKGGTEQ